MWVELLPDPNLFGPGCDGSVALKLSVVVE